jgi:hypothetical protein
MSNWPAAIEKNRAALLRVVAALFFYAGLDEGGADTVPRRVWRRIVRLLRPAEAAVRRLIVIAARNIEIEPPKPRAEKPPTGIERLVAAGVLTFHEVNLGLACAWSERTRRTGKIRPRHPRVPADRPAPPLRHAKPGRQAPVPAGRLRPGRPGRGGRRPPSLPPHQVPESRAGRSARSGAAAGPLAGAAGLPGFKVVAGRFRASERRTAACRLRQGRREA